MNDIINYIKENPYIQSVQVHHEGEKEEYLTIYTTQCKSTMNKDLLKMMMEVIDTVDTVSPYFKQTTIIVKEQFIYMALFDDYVLDPKVHIMKG